MQDYQSKYSGEEIDALLDKAENAQERIPDLEDIREGATKGATALQSVPDEYVTEEELEGKGYAVAKNVANALATKVTRVAGKDLSTEDFTTALKEKLEALNNYDDSEIAEAVAQLRSDFDTLVKSDTSGAIDKFNEIIAFLEGIEDSQSLDSIIAAIERQIAGKQDTIEGLDTIRRGAGKGNTSVQGVVVNDRLLMPDSRGYISLPTIPTKNDIDNMGFTQNKGTVTGVMVNGESKSPNSDGIVDLGDIEGGGGNVSFINNDSLQGLPFGYIGGYYRSYEFDGVSTEEVNLGYIDNFYYDTIAIAYNDILYEERISRLMGDGKVLGTVVVRVDDSYNLYVKQVSPKKTTFGWRMYTGKQLMPDSWVDLENYNDGLKGKQDTLTLTVKDNGNIVLGNIAGQTKEFMPATPSGDPMHYAYEAAGAVWNNDTGFWEYRAVEGGLTDLTNEDMKVCYAEAWLNTGVISGGMFYNMSGRTIITNANWSSAVTWYNYGRGANLEAGFVCARSGVKRAMPSSISAVFCNCPKLKRVIGKIDLLYCKSAFEISNSPLLEEITFSNLRSNVSIKHSSNISKVSILGAINDSYPDLDSSITIAVEASVYARLSADADIIAALEAHPRITLISA